MSEAPIKENVQKISSIQKIISSCDHTELNALHMDAYKNDRGKL